MKTLKFLSLTILYLCVVVALGLSSVILENKWYQYKINKDIQTCRHHKDVIQHSEQTGKDIKICNCYKHKLYKLYDAAMKDIMTDEFRNDRQTYLNSCVNGEKTTSQQKSR